MKRVIINVAAALVISAPVHAVQPNAQNIQVVPQHAGYELAVHGELATLPNKLYLTNLEHGHAHAENDEDTLAIHLIGNKWDSSDAALELSIQVLKADGNGGAVPINVEDYGSSYIPTNTSGNIRITGFDSGRNPLSNWSCNLSEIVDGGNGTGACRPGIFDFGGQNIGTILTTGGYVTITFETGCQNCWNSNDYVNGIAISSLKLDGVSVFGSMK